MESSEMNFKGKEIIPSDSYLQGKKLGETFDWERLREEVLSLRTPDSRTINQIGSYPHGIAIAELPDDADQNDFLEGMRSAMEEIYTDGGFMVEYSHDDQAKILGGVDPSSLKRKTIFFIVDSYERTSGQPENH